MNAGLSNLATLKARVLPPDYSSTKADDQIASIGLGVAAMFESYCARKWERTVDAVEDHSFVGSVVALNRFPVESVTSVQWRTDEDDAFETIETRRTSLSSGLIYLEQFSRLGDTVRVTYTGGYWWDTDEGDQGVQPNGSATVPFDLFDAWTTQVQHVIEARNILGGQSLGGNERQEGLSTANTALLPYVKELLQPFRRLV